VTICRLQHTSVSGFPLRGSIAACHVLRPAPPSSNPACGFPALGFPENSRLGHTQGVARSLLSLLAQLTSQPREFLRHLHLLAQSGCRSFQCQILRNRTLVQSALLLYRHKRVFGQAPSLHPVSGASLLIWACPTPDRGHHRVMSSPVMLCLGPHPVGPPRFLGQSFSMRRPLSPRRARQPHTPVASLPALGFTYPGRMATLIEFNEAETGSLALRLTPSPHEASPDQVTLSHARSATCQTGNSHGRLLSAYKIDQASPGAPGLT